MTDRAADLVAAARPLRIALVLAGLAVMVLAASWIDYDAVQVETFYGIPALTAGGLLLLAALLALVARGVAATRSPLHVLLAPALGASAVLLADLARRLDPRDPLPGLTELGLGVAVVAAAAVLRLRLVAAGGALLVGGAASTLASPPVGGRLGFALTAAGAVAAATGLARAIDARRAGPAPALGSAALAFVRGLDPRVHLAVSGLAVAGCAMAGLAFELDVVSTQSFNLNAEETPPAVISSALLLWAALLAAAFAAGDEAERTSWWIVAGFLAFLAFDEVSTVHEEFQELTGVKGQVFLLPLLVAAGIAGLRLVRRLSAYRRAQRLLIAGGVAWGLGQAIDMLQKPPDHFMWTVVPEELLELLGSVLVAYALIMLARTPRPAGEPVPQAA